MSTTGITPSQSDPTTRHETAMTALPPMTVTTEGIPQREHVHEAAPAPDERWAAVLEWTLGIVIAVVVVLGIGYGLGAQSAQPSPGHPVGVTQTYPLVTHHGV
jgi:hypothetical protein